jgi:hypothetical protein
MPDGSFEATFKPETEGTKAEDAKTENTSKRKDPREVSTIGFPYHTLADAIAVAGTILDKGAVPMARDQLSAAMGNQPDSGNFTNKLATTRMFGLMETVSGKYQLTRLGFDILDSDAARVKSAKAQAFLNVPLYRRTYDEFRNALLPPRPHGLENAFVSFGVSAKQKDKARRAFENSARLAGYFDNGNDKLLAPVIMPNAEKPQIDRGPDSRKRRTQTHDEGHDGDDSADNHFIKGLFDELPARVGDKWGYAGRLKWLQLAAQCFDMLYEVEHDSSATIKITLADSKLGPGKRRAA